MPLVVLAERTGIGSDSGPACTWVCSTAPPCAAHSHVHSPEKPTMTSSRLFPPRLFLVTIAVFCFRQRVPRLGATTATDS